MIGIELAYPVIPGLALLALALALAMDAFAVSVAQGASRRPGLRGAAAMGLTFGVAQGLMPLAGWALGVTFADWLRSVDHWVAFVLLAVLGGKMLLEALDKGPETPLPALIGWTLLGAAVATSIDAAAAGITLPMIGSPIGSACLVIGLVTGGLCFAGVLIGQAFGARIGKAAEVLGGVVLIGIGLKILIEHLLFGA